MLLQGNKSHATTDQGKSGTHVSESKDLESDVTPNPTPEEQKQVSKLLEDALNSIRELEDTGSKAADNSAHANREVYDIPEAAYYMHTSIRTTRDLIAKGKIKYVRFNRRIYLRKQDCDAFIAKHVV
jgi:excisionase family DNA binding protein